AAESSLQICSNCNRPIRDGRQGTMTQFIFRDGQCRCDAPSPLAQPDASRFNPGAISEEATEAANELELPLEADKFPMERYKPIAEIGVGSSGIVYLCRDRLLGKKVAVKILQTLTTPQLVLFQEEARATSQLKHPNIVTTLDFGATESGVPFMVMEYVDGVNLEQRLNDGTLSTGVLIKIACSLCDALAYAHDHSVYHRDIKPSNILLSKDHRGELTVSLIDFGVAAVKESTGSITNYQGRSLAGTPAYMCPDVVSGYDYNARSEVYSLGCVLFEAIEGRPPFSSDNPLAVLRQHAEEPVPELTSQEISRELKALIRSMLAKSPNDRPVSMLDLKSSLQEIQILESPDHTSAPTSKVARVLSTAAAIAVMTICAAAFLLASHQKSSTDSMPPSANRHSKSDDSTLSELRRCIARGDRVIDLTERDVTEKQLSALINTDVRELKLDDANLTPGCLSVLSKLVSLQSLHLNSTKVNGEHLTDVHLLSFLPKLHNLSSLELVETKVALDPKAIELSSLKYMRNLDLADTNITDDSISSVAKLPSLDSLFLCGASKITPDGISRLKESVVKHLWLGRVKIKPGDLKKLTKLTNLQGMYLGKELKLESFNYEDLKALASMPLTTVEFHLSKIEPGALKELAKSKTLRNLKLNWCQYDRQDVAYLKGKLPSVKFVVKEGEGEREREDFGLAEFFSEVPEANK
ncbi:MAG: protein kinase, partial [Candidatus Obscuribacterales bacterium]|nr:protein kinase [Candidatus Obscuribacterales bacterium]